MAVSSRKQWAKQADEATTRRDKLNGPWPVEETLWRVSGIDVATGHYAEELVYGRCATKRVYRGGGKLERVK